MGKIEKRKRFKHPHTYYGEFVFFGLLSIFGVFLTWYTLQMMSDEMIEHFATRELYGTAEGRRAQLILMMAAKYFGRKGLIVLFIFLTIEFLYLLIKEIKEFKRYKHKCRLYHEGLIKNFYDIYDDYVPLLSWRRIKKLFSKKEKTYKKKYPSKRKMKKQIKELEKQNR